MACLILFARNLVANKHGQASFHFLSTALRLTRQGLISFYFGGKYSCGIHFSFHLPLLSMICTSKRVQFPPLTPFTQDIHLPARQMHTLEGI